MQHPESNSKNVQRPNICYLSIRLNTFHHSVKTIHHHNHHHHHHHHHHWLLKFSCSHLSFRFYTCFEQGIPWHSGNYRVWINSETRTWDDKNIQSNAPYRLHHIDYSRHSLIIWPVPLNGWVFFYELSGCRFESSCSYLSFY